MGWNPGGWGSGSGWQTPTPISPQTQAGQQALGIAQGMAGPSLIQNDINASRLANQLGYGDAQYGLGVDALNQNTALDRARLGINANDIGIDRESLMRQIGVNDQLHMLAKQLFGVDAKGLGLTQDAINSRLGTQNRGFDNQRIQAMSQRTARGAVGSVGHNRELTNITADQHDAWDAFWRDTSMTNLDRERLGIRGKESDINFGENKAKIEDRMKMLNNQAAKLGIDAKQLDANLQQGLARLGVDRLFSANDLFDAMLSNDVERQAIAQQIFRDALNMVPGLMQQITMPGSTTTPVTSTSGTGTSGASGGFSGGGGSPTRQAAGGSW